MKLFIVILVIVVIVGSIVADYFWRRWMADRRRERE
jgi:hypothetical protein